VQEKIRLLHEQYTADKKQELAKQLARIGRDAQKSGMHSSSVHVNKNLDASKEYVRELLNWICDQHKELFANETLSSIKPDLMEVLKKEIPVLHSRTNSLLARTGLGSLSGYKQAIDDFMKAMTSEISRKCELDDLTRKSHKIIGSDVDLKLIKVNWRVLRQWLIQKLYSTKKGLKKFFKKDS